MKLIIFLLVAILGASLVASGEQQRILRRVIKSTPTATNLSRVRIVTTRSLGAERGVVSEISSKEASNFGQRSSNDTSAPTAAASTAEQQPLATKTKQASPVSTQSPTEATPIATTSAPGTTPAPAPTSTQTTSSSTTATQPRASDRQQQQQGEVELLSGAPSSWQMMAAVEAPAAALIAAGTRHSLVSSDLSSSSSEDSSFISQSGSGDFLRSSGTKGASRSAGETFSRLRQQSTKSRFQEAQQQQQQQTYFYPQQQNQQQLRVQSKTSNYQATKNHWYQPSTTTPRPAPIIQEQQQYEQQNEQYVEQQQVESAAPPGQAEPFAFDFKTQDQSGNGQYRKEESDKNGVVRGSYGYWSDGIYRQVNYIADENGFRAQIQSNEPGMKKDAEAQPASVELRS